MKNILWKASRLLPDKLYLNLMFFKHFRRFPNWNNLKTYNEKLQWLKLHDRRPEYTNLVDKVKVKDIIAEVIGEEYIIPTLKVWDNADDIILDELPDQFVLKCNHDSKSTIVCKDKNTFDLDKAKRFLNNRLKVNGFWYGREWPYKNVKPVIFAEKFMKDESEEASLRDYKVLCFNEKAKVVEVHRERGTDKYTQDFYDTNWNSLGISQPGSPNYERDLERPKLLDTMIDLSEKLAKNKIHVRIDWYIICGKLYFGEVTFFDGSGFMPFSEKKDDEYLGSLMDLGI